MNGLFKLKFFTALIMSLVAFGAVDAAAQTRSTRKKPVIRRAAVKRTVVPAARLYRIASGERIRVRMNNTLSSKTARIGDRFTTTVTEPVYSDGGVVVIPTGSTVSGRVTAVKAARKGGDPGSIDVTFYQVRTPNGTTRAINGSLTDLDTSRAKSDNEGAASGDKMKNRKVIFIGGGGAGGAILGAAIGGGKGAVIGGLLGAGAGLLGERFTKGENAEVKSGTEFGIYLNQAVSLPRFVERD